MQESGQKEVSFPSSFMLLMLRTCGVDAPPPLGGGVAPMGGGAKQKMLYHGQRDLG